MLADVNALDASVPLHRLSNSLADGSGGQIRRAVVKEHLDRVSLRIFRNQFFVINENPDAGTNVNGFVGDCGKGGDGQTDKQKRCQHPQEKCAGVLDLLFHVDYFLSVFIIRSLYIKGHLLP